MPEAILYDDGEYRITEINAGISVRVYQLKQDNFGNNYWKQLSTILKDSSIDAEKICYRLIQKLIASVQP